MSDSNTPCLLCGLPMHSPSRGRPKERHNGVTVLLDGVEVREPDCARMARDWRAAARALQTLARRAPEFGATPEQVYKQVLSEWLRHPVPWVWARRYVNEGGVGE